MELMLVHCIYITRALLSFSTACCICWGVLRITWQFLCLSSVLWLNNFSVAYSIARWSYMFHSTSITRNSTTVLQYTKQRVELIQATDIHNCYSWESETVLSVNWSEVYVHILCGTTGAQYFYVHCGTNCRFWYNSRIRHGEGRQLKLWQERNKYNQSYPVVENCLL